MFGDSVDCIAEQNNPRLLSCFNSSKVCPSRRVVKHRMLSTFPRACEKHKSQAAQAGFEPTTPHQHTSYQLNHTQLAGFIL